MTNKYVTFDQLRDVVFRKNSLQVNGAEFRLFSETLVLSRHRCAVRDACTKSLSNISHSFLYSVPITALLLFALQSPVWYFPPSASTSFLFLPLNPLAPLSFPSQAEMDLKLLSSKRAQFLSDYLVRKAAAQERAQIMAARSFATSAELNAALRTVHPWSESFTGSAPPLLFTWNCRP
jgi:hypothetical protein